MTKIVLPDTAAPLLCMQRASEGEAAPRGAGCELSLQGRGYLIGLDLYDRAASFTVDTIYEAALSVLGLHGADITPLTPAGFTAAWAAGYRQTAESLLGAYRGGRYAEFRSDAERRLEKDPQEEARALVREVHLIAKAGDIRDLFDHMAEDLRAYSGLRSALWEVDAKAQLPQIRAVLLSRGFGEDKLKRIAALEQTLHEGYGDRLVREGAGVEQAAVLQALKAVLLGDLTMLSTTARAQLSGSRWEYYQIGRLLGTARPADRRSAGPAEPQPPAPTPLAPHPPVLQPTPRPAPVPAAGGSGGVPGASSSAGTQPTPTAFVPPLSAASMTTATPLASLGLPPGTELCRVPMADGAAVSLVVQPDGTAAWIPPASPSTAPPPAPRARTRRR